MAKSVGFSMLLLLAAISISSGMCGFAHSQKYTINPPPVNIMRYAM
jgi:hypothetical protein